MSRLNNSAKNAFYGIIDAAINYLAPFVLKTVLLRTLGDQYLGLNNLFHSILEILSVAEAGFGSAILFSMYKPLAEGNDEKVCGLLALYKKIYFAVGMIVLLVGIACIPFLDKLITNGYPDGVVITYIYIVYLSEIVLRFLFFAYKEALLYAKQLVSINHKIALMIDSVIFLLRLLVLLKLKNYYVFISFLPVSVILKRSVISIYVSRKYPQYFKQGKVENDEKRRIVSLSKDIAIHRFGETVSSSLGNIVISANIGLTAVAIYGNYVYIYKSLLGIIKTFIDSTAASVGDLVAANKKKENSIAVFEKINAVNLWMSSWCSACLFCLYKHFMLLWVKQELTANNYVSFVFTALFYIENCRRVLNLYKTSAGLWREDRYKPLISGLINAIITYVLVKRIGYVGSAISLALINIFICIPWECRILFNNFFNTSSRGFYFQVFKNISVTVLAAAVSYLVCSQITAISVITFIIKGITVFAISNIIFFVFYRNNVIYIDTFNQICSLIKRK